MNKIYALFSSQDGDGTRCLFITSLRTLHSHEKAKNLVSIFPHIGKASFFIGEADEYQFDRMVDMEEYTWTIPDLGNAEVYCKQFPIFE